MQTHKNRIQTIKNSKISSAVTENANSEQFADLNLFNQFKTINRKGRLSNKGSLKFFMKNYITNPSGSTAPFFTTTIPSLTVYKV